MEHLSENSKIKTDPKKFETKKIKLNGNDPDQETGEIFFTSWTEQEAKKRALKKTIRIIGSIYGVSLIGLFVHILLPILIPTNIIATLVAIPLYLKWSNERATFSHATGYCPQCKKETQFRPYVSAQLLDSVTLQCPDCGQTIKADVHSLT